MRLVHALLLSLSLGLLVYAGAANGPDEAPKRRKVEFSRDVRPILSNVCYKCHGPDTSVSSMTGLRLDSFEAATEERDGSSAIVPGHPDKSLVMTRIADKSEARMPPPDSGHPALTDAQIETIKIWIEDGARYTQHWAFVRPVSQPVPKNPADKWSKSDIDRFVWKGLDDEGLHPEPEADKATLLRRLSLTLTGLPPSPEEAEAFAKDHRKDAYEREVDRLLASPRYGEHQARFWLDAVRYGDTHGLHLDNERLIWPYRDWVVRAYNEDLPYDRFTVWQLAGDLLANPTTEQLVASGYVRMNPTTNEGGAIEEEFLAKNTFDRVDTMSTVFLGLTVACARCHDHKFDPVTQKDYYGLFAFMNSTADRPLDGNELVPAPVVRAATPGQEATLRKWQRESDVLVSAVKLGEAKAWLASFTAESPEVTKWEIAGPFSAPNFDQAFAQSFPPETDQTIEWQPYELKSGEAKTPFGGKENAATYLRGSVRSSRDAPVEFSFGSDDGIKVWVNGQLVHENKVLRGLTAGSDKVKADLRQGDNSVLVKVVNSGGPDGVSAEIGDALGRKVTILRADLATPSKKSQAEQELRATFLEAGPASAAAMKYRGLRAEYQKLESSIPLSLVAQELPQPRPAYVLKRGEYNLPGEKVERGVPGFLGRLPANAPKNRLGLAQWLVHPENPLVARVFVNRIWQQHFGTGLVKTSEDFGNQGSWPSNKELLDWLALDFVKDGWSLKKLHKKIVMSAAFRQRSSVTKAKLEKDPENLLVSRGPRYRLDAEVIRDQALYVAGLLKENHGGKGFRPYQPRGLWEAIAFVESTTSKYVPDMGDNIYRRSLYLFWKRTSPPPVMLTFDAPMREACVVRRSRTNTPLQALATLNETAFAEAARVMAARVLKSENNDGDRMALAFELALGRNPSESERTLLNRSLASYVAKYKADTKAALAVVHVGQAPVDSSLDPARLAAWTLVCGTLMNLDETLTQH